MLLLVALGCASARASQAASAIIMGNGAFRLAPGESRTIRVSATYRSIRICNDASSSGNIEGSVVDRPAVLLPPGSCSTSIGFYGDRITVRNLSSGAATGLFQSSGTKPAGRGGASRE
jgi:hypothetical protein